MCGNAIRARGMRETPAATLRKEEGDGDEEDLFGCFEICLFPLLSTSLKLVEKYRIG